MPPADAWPIGPDPTKPKPVAPQRDWSRAPWGDVAWQAAKGLVPSYASDLWNSGVGLVKHLTTPTTSTFQNQAPSANEPVTMGLIRAASDAMLGTHSQTRPTVADFGAGVGHYAGSRYGSVPALKRTLATDPGGALMDAQALATIPEGGEGLVARVPGLGGDVLRGGATAARTFNKFTNPVGLAARGATATTGALRTAIKGGPVLDKTGAFTPAVQAAVQQAFPKGEITAAELANPTFRAQLTSTLQTKGINPAAVKEAVLAYHGAPTPASIVTRTRPGSNVVAETADAERTRARQAVNGQATSIVGAPPDPTALGAAVQQAHDASLAQAGQNYTDLKAIPGTFGPSLNGQDLNAHVGARLALNDMPATPALLQRSEDAYPQANAAVKLVNNSLVNGETRLGGEITTPEVAEVRRQLTGIRNQAKGSDQAAVQAVIDGLHDHLESTSAQGQFVGPNGPVDISGQLKNANAAYQKHFDTFDNTQGPSGVLARTVKSLKGSDKAEVPDADAQLAAGQGVAKALAHPTQGPATYSLLKSSLTPEGQSALDDYVRKSSVLNPDGSPVKADDLRANLNGPTGKLFTPQEQSDLRLSAAANDVLDAKAPPGSAMPSPLTGRLARTAVGMGIGAGATALGGPLFGHVVEGLPDLLGGGAAGGVIEQALEPYFQGRAIKRELAGAPEPGAFLKTPEALAKFSADTAPVLPVVHGLQESQPHDAVAPAAEPTLAPEVDLSTAPGPMDEAPAPLPIDTKAARERWPIAPSPPPDVAPTNAPASPDDGTDLSTAPGPMDSQGYAAGGKVGDDVERLVTRLQNLAKHAKSATKKATEPLLKVPDAAITKALDVAQKAI